MSHTNTRRDFVRLAAGAAAIAQSLPAQTGQPSGRIDVFVSAGEKRYSKEPPLQWQPAQGPAEGAILLDPAKTYQELLGFGASLTDASCYMFNQLAPNAREQLFHELFHPSGTGLSACRICIGSSDYATKAYSFDEGEPDPEMKRFSIEHDREYILPMLRLARKVNPDLFLLASPWSPPGWMKANKSMLGGAMRQSSLAPYALYFLKFLQAYAAEGVPVNAVTSQNEVDAEQDGRMPACVWPQEMEMWFISRALGPLLARNDIATKIWLLDHNYNLWGRVLCQLEDRTVNQYVDGVAWHGYAGREDAMTKVHDAYPAKHAYWTEGGPEYREPGYQTNFSRWSGTFTGILRNWSRCIMAWNMALDEQGRPNIGPFYCGGVVTIDSRTKAITRSGQYWALAHYSRAMRRGARRFDSLGDIAGLSHVAFANPDGGKVVVLTNPGAARTARLRLGDMMADAALPADSVTTLSWS